MTEKDYEPDDHHHTPSGIARTGLADDITLDRSQKIQVLGQGTEPCERPPREYQHPCLPDLEAPEPWRWVEEGGPSVEEGDSPH